MRDQFFDSRRLSREQLAGLLPRRNGPAVRRFLAQYAVFVGSVALLAAADRLGLPAWASVAPILAVALSVMAMFALTHETAHRTAFASPTMNRVAAWLAAAPFLYMPAAFQEFHFAHHRHTHDPGRDPEISLGGEPGPAVTSSWFMYLGFLSGLPLLLYKIAMLCAAAVGGPKAVWERLFFYVRPQVRRRITWQARVILAAHAVTIAAALRWFPGLFLVYAGLALGHALLAGYIMAEHNGLPHAGNVLERTRTTRANAFVKWLMWNMPYHAEHHAYPAVPYHALPALHEALAPELVNVGDGYLAFHRSVVTALARGGPFAA